MKIERNPATHERFSTTARGEKLTCYVTVSNWTENTRISFVSHESLATFGTELAPDMLDACISMLVEARDKLDADRLAKQVEEYAA